MAYVTDSERPHMGGNLPGGDDNTYCGKVWEWLCEEHLVQSVIDVGCGTGVALREFQRLGCITLGVEGLPKNVIECPAPVLMLDLGKDFVPLPEYDLVWCCEVVEHIEEEGVDNLVRLITSGRMLAMTHAVPGQVGYHHVNCQPPEYWIEKIEATGKKWDEDMSAHARSLCPESNYFHQSGMIFI